jgi:hypothetical protein
MQSQSDPCWNDVEARINMLRTVDSGSVFLKDTNGSWLSIGGEYKNGFVVFISCDRGESYVLAPPQKRKGIVSVIVGFQLGDYPKRIIVDLDTCIQVARSYFLTGEANKNYDWASDGTTVEY